MTAAVSPAADFRERALTLYRGLGSSPGETQTLDDMGAPAVDAVGP